MKRRTRTTFTVLLVLCVLLVVGWISANFHAAGVLERAVEQARAAGLPMTLAENRPAPLPDHQNAAFLYLAAIDLAHTVPGFDAVDELSEDWEAGTVPIPEPLRLALPAYEEVFGLLRRAAKIPGCAFPQPSDPVNADPAVNVFEVLELASLMVASALELADSEDPGAAAAELRCVVAMGNAIASEASLMSQMVRIAILGQITVAAESVLPGCASAVAAFDAIDFPALHGATAAGVAAELAYIGELLGEDQMGALSSSDLRLHSSILLDSNWLTDVFLNASRPYWRRSLANAIDYKRQVAVAGRLPYPEALDKVSNLMVSFHRNSDFLMRLFTSNYGPLLMKEASISSRIELLRLGARVLDHRHDTGSLPIDLTDLRDGPMPLDPTTGTPFVMERDGDGILLRNDDDNFVSWHIPF